MRRAVSRHTLALAVWCLGPLGFVVCGCANATRPGVETIRAGARDRVLAEQLCDQADALFLTEPERAEALLREAISADPSSGRARNNLGVLCLSRGQLFEAATEFDLARRLLPDDPDPRINLGIALERAGRVDEAIASYRAAVDLQPGHLAAMQSLARAQVRHRREDDRTPELLAEIALRGNDDWRRWAIPLQTRAR